MAPHSGLEERLNLRGFQGEGSSVCPSGGGREVRKSVRVMKARDPRGRPCADRPPVPRMCPKSWQLRNPGRLARGDDRNFLASWLSALVDIQNPSIVGKCGLKEANIHPQGTLELDPAESNASAETLSERQSSSSWAVDLRQRLLDPLRAPHNPPWFNSRAAAVGLAAGFACPLGSQLPVITVLRLFLRFNTILALAFSFVSNPFTVVPLYYVYYLLGSLILGQPEGVNAERFNEIIQTSVGSGYFWDVLPAFLSVGREVLVRWCVSAGLLAAVFGTLGYLFASRFQERWRPQEEQG
jgi:uncharacterized protein (DUF2062 family)